MKRMTQLLGQRTPYRIHFTHVAAECQAQIPKFAARKLTNSAKETKEKPGKEKPSRADALSDDQDHFRFPVIADGDGLVDVILQQRIHNAVASEDGVGIPDEAGAVFVLDDHGKIHGTF